MSFVNAFPTVIGVFSSIISSEELKEWGYGEDYISARIVALRDESLGSDSSVPTESELGVTTEKINLELSILEGGRAFEVLDRRIVEYHAYLFSDLGVSHEFIISNKASKQPVEIEVRED